MSFRGLVSKGVQNLLPLKIVEGQLLSLELFPKFYNVPLAL